MEKVSVEAMMRELVKLELAEKLSFRHPVVY